MNDQPLEDELHDALHRTADPLHRAPLTVGDVRGRARRIQRRRATVAGAAIAAVLAIAVPVGLNVTGGPDSDPVRPASQSPSPSPSPSAIGTIRVDPRSAPTDDALGVPLVDVDEATLIADGTVTALPQPYDQLTPYLDGWLGLANNEQVFAVRRLDADFEVVDETPDTSAMSISADGSRIAWLELDGAVWSVVDVVADGSRDERRTPLPDLAAEPTPDVVGFASDTEVVVSQTSYHSGDVVTLRVDGSSAVPVTGLVRPWAASAATAVIAGVVRVKKDLSSCSAVIDPRSGASVWKTCDHTLAGFSPDGAYAVGLSSYLDGYGSPTLAILDAATGESVVDFELLGPPRGVVGINERMVWEDADSLIVTVVSGEDQYVVRLNLDGTVQRITAPGTELAEGRTSLVLATS